MKKPNLFIVGAPKCGTTSMYNYLKQHPEVFMSSLKEPHFFGTDLVSSNFIREKEKYLSLFSNATDEKRIGEGSVWMLYSKVAAAEIKEFSPEARIIMILRNPVDMIFSLHGEHYFWGDENIRDFKKALMVEEKRRQGLKIPVQSKVKFGLLYREIAKYDHQVERYLRVFGQDNVKVIIFDEFKHHTERIFSDTCQFLEIDSRFKPEFKIVNARRVVHSRTLMHFVQHPPNFSRRLGKAIPSSIRHRMLSFIEKKGYEVKPAPPMDEKLRRQLQQEFLPSVERLSILLKRDLTYWCGTTRVTGTTFN